MANVTSRDDMSSKDYIESNRRKTHYFKNSKFDAPEATGETYLSVSSNNEECNKYTCYTPLNKKIKTHSYSSRTGSSETPSESYSNIVSCNQEQKQKQAFLSDQNEKRNIYINHQRSFTNQSLFETHKFKQRRRKQNGTSSAAHQDTCDYNCHQKSVADLNIGENNRYCTECMRQMDIYFSGTQHEDTGIDTNHQKSVTDQIFDDNSKQHDPHTDWVLTREWHPNNGNARGRSTKDENAQNVSLRQINSSTTECIRKSLTVSKFATEGNKQATNDAFAPDQLGRMDTRALNKSLVEKSKKLLVLDLNGILVDILSVPNAVEIHAEREHINVSQKKAFKRPFCDDFLNFCFHEFDIGIWSSRMKHNVEVVVNYLMGDRKRNLLFCWDNSKCTHTGFTTLGNYGKPLVLKELRKLWNKEEPDLPWNKGRYSASNTLLIDDSPSKALCNPPCTGIFPQPYSFRDEKDDSLGPGGDIRVFLEGLAKADSVQDYVEKNPFGQGSITDCDPSWKFYLKVRQRVEKRNTMDGPGSKTTRKKKKRRKKKSNNS